MIVSIRRTALLKRAIPMNRLLTLRKRLFAVLWSLLLVAVTAVPALAQAEEENVAKESWVLSYFLVALGIALGMVAICRMGKRKKDFRQIEY